MAAKFNRDARARRFAALEARLRLVHPANDVGRRSGAGRHRAGYARQATKPRLVCHWRVVPATMRLECFWREELGNAGSGEPPQKRRRPGAPRRPRDNAGPVAFHRGRAPGAIDHTCRVA